MGAGCECPSQWIGVRDAGQSASREAVDVRKRGPDGLPEFFEAWVYGDEAKALVEADGYTDESAVNIDDVGLQHGAVPSDAGSAGNAVARQPADIAS